MKTSTLNNWKIPLVCLIFSGTCPGTLISQEIIRFKSGHVDEAKITRLTKDTVIYQLLTEQSVTRSARMDQVESISSSPPLKPVIDYSPGFSARYSQLPLLEQAHIRMKSAQRVSTAGIILGCLNHVSLLINGGFLRGNSDVKGYQMVTAIVGGSTGTVRLTLSMIQFSQLHKAEQAVMLVRQLPENEGKFSHSLKCIRTARYISTAVPVLGGTAAALMIAGYLQKEKLKFSVEKGYYYDTAGKNGFLIAAWVTMGATLATSVVSAICISNAKTMLLNESGKLSVGINSDGIGLRVGL